MWHGTRLWSPDWSNGSRTLALHLAGEHAARPDCDVYIAFNSSDEAIDFELPEPAPGAKWMSLIDTAAHPPGDFIDGDTEVAEAFLRLEPRSTRVLRSW
jgi:glycogen operon protein